MKGWHQILLLITLAGSFYSCNKIRAHKYSGTYDCTVQFHSYIMGGYFFDTTYSEVVIVEQDGDEITVLDHTVPAKSLKNGTLYDGTQPHAGFTLKFVKDSIYASVGYSGLGGASSKSYQGKKSK